MGRAVGNRANFQVAPSYVFNVPLGLIRNSRLCGPAQFHRWQGGRAACMDLFVCLTRF